jgi:hypothetical protein
VASWAEALAAVQAGFAKAKGNEVKAIAGMCMCVVMI